MEDKTDKKPSSAIALWGLVLGVLFALLLGAMGNSSGSGSTLQQQEHDRVVDQLCVIHPDQPGC